MSGVEHQGHGQGLKRAERAQKKINGYKFCRAGKDRQAHEHGVPEAEAGDIHVNAVSHAQKEEAGKDRDGIRKGAFKRLSHDLRLFFHNRYL